MKESKFNIPKEVSQVTEALENAGFEAYIVGGCVRDLIIKIPFSVKSLIKEAEYINERRWNIILQNNIIIIKVKSIMFRMKYKLMRLWIRL